MGLLDENKLAEALRNFSGLLSSVPSNANMLARGLLEYADNNRQQARNAFNAQGLTLGGKPVTAVDIDTAMQGASFAPLGVTAWHGSPHKFSKFDMSKIGTGEGAQAYGHGLYVAESPDVAMGYANRLAKTKVGEGVSNFQSVPTTVADKAAAYVEWGQRNGVFSPNAVKDGSAWDSVIKHAKEWERDDSVIGLLQKLKEGNAPITKEQNLYKVDIPDEAVARFLDWDRSLSEQPHILNAIAASDIPAIGKNAIGWRGAPEGAWERAMATRNGEWLYREIANNDPVATSQALKNLGVNGISYLDAGSRASGKGSSNYVLFSDQLPRILEVNGQATGAKPWKPGEWNGLLSP